MLSDDVLQLLTAYVDGELTPRQREAVTRLLSQSSEARAVLRQLQENAHKLRDLPRHSPGADFADDVLAHIRPQAPRRVAPRRRWPVLAAVAAAAAVMLAFAGVAYYYGTLPNEPAFVELPPVTPKKTPQPETPHEVPPPKRAPDPLVANLIDGVYRNYVAPIPKERGVVVAFNDLAKPGPAADVQAELAKNNAVDFDIKVRDNAEAVARLGEVLKGHGIKLLVDPASQASMKEGRRDTEYWLYAENIRPDELAKVLKQLAQPAASKPAPFEKLSVAALPTHEHRQVIALLGIDPASTLGSTQGIMNDPNRKSPRPATRERVAVVLPPSPSSRTSEEVRQFLYQPNRPQPGTLRVLVKIHQD